VGQAGRLSVIKEAREGGTGYWYVYRTQKRQTHKRYLGSSDKVTLTRLEQEARVLNTLLPPPLVPRLLHHRSRGQSYFLPSSLLPVCLWHWWCALACSRNCKASPLIG
jgi:LuxR family maltose regulon positive regulatory protein